MRNQFHGRKRTSLALGLLLAVAVAGGAFAYWSITGSGTGTASAGTVTDNLVIEQQGTVTGLYPGGAEQTVVVDITNPNASSPVMVADLSGAVVSTDKAGCDANNFAVGNDVALNTMIGAGATISNSGLTVRMLETGVDQNACQGANVTLSFSVSVP